MQRVFCFCPPLENPCSLSENHPESAVANAAGEVMSILLLGKKGCLCRRDSSLLFDTFPALPPEQK